MNIYFGLALCFLPYILFFIGISCFGKTKILHQFIASFLALIAVLPITFIQFWLEEKFSGAIFNKDSLFNLFIKALLVNGFLEEIMRIIFMIFIPAKNNNVKQYFLLSLLCGLCLGCFESMIYLLQNLQSNNLIGGQFLWGLIFARIFTSDLIHMFCAGLCGLFIWSIKNKHVDIGAIVFAVLIHGIYDFFAYFNNGMYWFCLAAILLALIECRVHYTKQNPELKSKNQNEKEDLTEEVVDQTLDGVRLEGNKLIKE
ncbi:MAG: PrsW family intramembrane metalloprotease [Treponema sp.]|nr:PrsW family intramembrane metalloprotease [Treponema sp.]